jgi:hypothetical protein
MKYEYENEKGMECVCVCVCVCGGGGKWFGLYLDLTSLLGYFDRLCGLVVSWLRNGDVLFPVRYELNLYMLCRRK